MFQLLNNYQQKDVIDKRVEHALKAKPDNFYAKYAEQYDVRDLVSPYFVNPHQKQMLTDIIGKQNVDDIEMLNALVYSGIINASCPPRGDPSRTQMYMDPVSGRMQCRRPMPETAWNWPDPNADKSAMVTCPGPTDNPMAFEKYIDADGQVKCRQPVLRGEFSCPPGQIRAQNGAIVPGDYTRNVTLSDGTGVCIEQDNISSAGLYPTGLISQDYSMINGESIYGRMKSYSNFLDDLGGNVGILTTLNKWSKESPYVEDFKSKIIRDPKMEMMTPILQTMQTPEDLKIFSVALHEHMMEKNPTMKGGRKAGKSRKARKGKKKSAKKTRKH